jgi:prevent-host-death family protein
MLTMNVHEAKTHLSSLLQGVARGDSFVIAKAGRPVAKVVPFTPETPPVRRTGFLPRGSCSVPDDFDDMAADEIAALFGARP